MSAAGTTGKGPHNKRPIKRRARTAGPTAYRGEPGGSKKRGGGIFGQKSILLTPPATHTTRGVKMKRSDVRFGNKEGGGTHFGSEERFAWQKAQYASDAMYTMPAVKAPPFSFGTSTRADWRNIMENTKDLHNPNGEKCGFLSLS